MELSKSEIVVISLLLLVIIALAVMSVTAKPPPAITLADGSIAPHKSTCTLGVLYLHQSRAATVAVDRQGKPVACEQAYEK